MHPNSGAMISPLGDLCLPVDRVSWARSRAGNMIKFVVKPTDRGWASYQEGAFVGEYPTRRAAMNALAKKSSKPAGSAARLSSNLEAEPAFAPASAPKWPSQFLARSTIVAVYPRHGRKLRYC